MPTNDFLPFGSAVGANVSTQAEYAALAARANGFTAGTAVSKQLNKAWRQSSVMSATLAQFIADQSGNDVLDDGNLATIQTNLGLAIKAAIASGIPYATQVQAEAGTSTTTVMSPLRVFQAIAKVVTQATESSFGWLKIATQALVNAGTDDATAVTPKKLAAAIQNQALTAFTTAGSSGALTLTPVPAIQSYAAPLRFRVKFSQNSTGTDTINVSGQGAKSLKQYDSTGAKVAAVFAASQLADVEYDGTDFVLLDQLPASSNTPVGTIISIASSTAPAGFLKANGAVVSRTTYPDLFSAIGTIYGAGDGSTTFGLPDMRGVFTRHWDDGRGIDVGRALGSGQSDDFKSHTHLINGSINFTYTSNPTSDFKYFSSGSSTSPTAATGGTETRPRNLALLACIKF